MMTKIESVEPPPTKEDRAAWQELRFRMHTVDYVDLQTDLEDMEPGFYKMAVGAVLMGFSIEQAWEVMRLEPGQMSQIIRWLPEPCTFCGQLPCNCSIMLEMGWEETYEKVEVADV